MSQPLRPWLQRRVLAYAHQGGAWEAPSSTLYAIERAMALGSTGIELDVHATADRRLVVCHDASVERTTDGSGAIGGLTLAQLEELDNAHWFAPGEDERTDRDPADYPWRGQAPTDRRFGVATLDEVLDLMEDHPDIALNLDIKGTTPDVEPYEELLADVLHRRGGTDRVIVASFLDAATGAFRRHAPDIATSAGTTAVAEFWRAVQLGEVPERSPHVALQVPATFMDQRIVDEPFVSAAHHAEMAVHVWTVNDAPAMGALIDLGVDGIFSDLPSTLVAILEERDLSYRPATT
jgi:glycerophosphoryl diester phosphodiesterase